jgi:hypothetical protein
VIGVIDGKRFRNPGVRRRNALPHDDATCVSAFKEKSVGPAKVPNSDETLELVAVLLELSLYDVAVEVELPCPIEIESLDGRSEGYDWRMRSRFGIRLANRGWNEQHRADQGNDY